MRRTKALKTRLLALTVMPSDPEDCWVWTGTKSNGYGKVTVNGKCRWAHRVWYEELNGPLATGVVLMHQCDNPSCVNPKHLQPGTQQENISDSRTKGRARIGHRSGELSYQSKLTWTDVEYIRTSTKSIRALAIELGVSTSTVHSARKGETWKTKGREWVDVVD